MRTACPIVLITLLLWCAPLAISAQDAAPSTIAVLLSDEITPYIEAAEGLNERLSRMDGLDIETIYLNRYNQKSRDAMKRQIISEHYSQIVTIGPEAARLVWAGTDPVNAGRVYTIVLNPDKIYGIDETACGIPLNIPVDQQLSAIAQGIPQVEKLGLLFDPANNSDFFDQANGLAPEFKLSVVPLRVSSRQQISELLRTRLQEVEAIWLIPDRTVISESIVQYIIKQGLLNETPVIGYNKFFYDSGAALSFVFDYKALGTQAAGVVADVRAGKPCGKRPPEFQVWLNQRVFDRLGLSVQNPPTPLIQVKP